MNFYNYREKFGFIAFGVPAFLPLVLHLVFIFDFDASGMNMFFYENIEIFKRAFEIKESNEVLVWGYVSSILYLIFILPVMVVRTKRTIFLGLENRNKIKLIWILLSFLLFSIFLFLNFVDFSSGSKKYTAVIELSFYFWPLFYFYFLFPIYMGFLLFFAFINTEIK